MTPRYLSENQITDLRQNFLDSVGVYINSKAAAKRYENLTRMFRIVKRYSPKMRPQARAEFGEFVSKHLLKKAKNAAAKGRVEDVKRIDEGLSKIHQLTKCPSDYCASIAPILERVDEEDLFRIYFSE